MVTQPTLHSGDFCTSEAVSAIPLLSKQTSRHTLYPMSNSPSKSSGRNPSAKRRKIRIFPHLLPPASFTAPALLPSLPPSAAAAPPSAPPRAVQRAKVREGVLPCWLAGCGRPGLSASGAVQKDGQRPRVRLRSETDRDGETERGSRLWPPAARSHMYTHACGLRNGHSASAAPTTTDDGHTEWARDDYLGARPPRRNRPPKT